VCGAGRRSLRLRKKRSQGDAADKDHIESSHTQPLPGRIAHRRLYRDGGSMLYRKNARSSRYGPWKSLGSGG
jgi:hypothetical protein